MTTTQFMKKHLDLLDEMFPGDSARGLPSFSALGPEALVDLEGKIIALMPYLRNLADMSDPPSEVNDTLKTLRKLAPDLTKDFLLAGLNIYFAAPAVVEALRGGPAALFPHARALPEIDFDLLHPVLELFSERECK